MNECREIHNECQYRAQECLPRHFRVIDVTRRCLVEIREQSFFALSYVWGEDLPSSLLEASSATIDSMGQEGGLPTSQMPRTIENAIQICIQLGQNHLWVDRLCVIQDDDEDKESQIEAMKEIFSSAELVLIAAYGDSMSFGIAGVGPSRSLTQQREHFLGLQVTNVSQNIQDDPLDLWHTRGWTYQEAVLSRRRLYLSNKGAHFECERLIYHEDRCNLEINHRDFDWTKLTLPQEHAPFQSYKRHIRHYGSRKLTYISDAYNAVDGILQSLYKGKSSFLHGLPRLDFDRALLWYPNMAGYTVERLDTGQEVLPTWSWSWSSVMNQSDQIFFPHTTFFGSLALWYSKEDLLSSLGTISTCSNHGVGKDWQTYMAIASSYGCFEEFPFTLSLQTSSFSTMRQLFKITWKGLRPPGMKMILSETQHVRSPTLKDHIELQNLKRSLIMARCQTTYLQLRTKRSEYDLDILNSEGTRIGELFGLVARLRKQVASSTSGSSVSAEFSAISLSGSAMKEDYQAEEREAKTIFDVNRNSLAKIPIVNVMMIGWGEHFAHRRALGWVYLIDWVKLDRKWKTIILG